MKRLLALLVMLTVSLSATVALAAQKEMQTREVCAHRQARFWAPGMSDWSEMLPVWELEVCTQISYDGETLKPLQEKPTVRFERYFPFALIWSAENCKTWQVKKDNGDLWVNGSCEVSWKVYAPVPFTVATWTVAQEFYLSPGGYQEITYPGWWRANQGEKPVPLSD